MRYVQFFHNGTDGKPLPMCGSDSVMLTDGRHNDVSVAATARTHAQRLNASLRKGIIGFAIIRGRLADPVPNNHPFTKL